MGENMMCSTHKTSTDQFREGWELTFGHKRTFTEAEKRELIAAMHMAEVEEMISGS